MRKVLHLAAGGCSLDDDAWHRTFEALDAVLASHDLEAAEHADALRIGKVVGALANIYVEILEDDRRDGKITMKAYRRMILDQLSLLDLRPTHAEVGLLMIGPADIAERDGHPEAPVEAAKRAASSVIRPLFAAAKRPLAVGMKAMGARRELAANQPPALDIENDDMIGAAVEALGGSYENGTVRW